MFQLLTLILLAVGGWVVGRWVGKKFSGTKKDVSALRRNSQTLSIALRELGLKRLPTILEEFTVGDVGSLFDSIRSLAQLVKEGNEPIVRELEGTFERMLGVKLNSPEGRAFIKARLEAAEKLAIAVAPAVAAAALAGVAPPVGVAAAAGMAGAVAAQK